MLAFTPEVESALRWFDATHEMVTADGRMWFRRTWHAGPGSTGEQDARLFEALELIRIVHDDAARALRQSKETDG